MSSAQVPASHRLARALVARLRGVVPGILEIEADGPDVLVRFGGSESRNGTAAILDEDDGRSWSERAATPVRAVLNHVQDAAADATGVPWPASGATLPLPQAEVVGGAIRMWFGERDAPVLVLDDLDLGEL